MKIKIKAYTETIKQLKSAILASRYKAAALANRELLALYFNVGKLIDEKTKQGKWGDKILEQLSNDLQKELPGLKGFSATNIKRMRLFYLAWNPCFTISPTLSDQFIQHFFSVSFSHHYELLVITKSKLKSLLFSIPSYSSNHASLLHT